MQTARAGEVAETEGATQKRMRALERWRTKPPTLLKETAQKGMSRLVLPNSSTGVAAQ